MKTVIVKAVLVVAAVALFIGGVSVTAWSADAAKKGKPQTVCPVMGDPINKNMYVDYKGYRIYFCCNECPEKFKKNPEKYMKKLKDAGVTLEKTPKGAEKKTPVKKDNKQHEHHHED